MIRRSLLSRSTRLSIQNHDQSLTKSKNHRNQNQSNQPHTRCTTHPHSGEHNSTSPTPSTTQISIHNHTFACRLPFNPWSPFAHQTDSTCTRFPKEDYRLFCIAFSLSIAHLVKAVMLPHPHACLSTEKPRKKASQSSSSRSNSTKNANTNQIVQINKDIEI